MKKELKKGINNIAIVWESETGGGVNSYLRYLLQSKAFLDKQITIFTNSENKGAKFLIKDFAQQKNIKFIFFNSFFEFDRKRSFLEKLIYYFLKPIVLLFAIYRFKKILLKSEFDVLLCTCGNYGTFRSEQAAILAARKNENSCEKYCYSSCLRKTTFIYGYCFLKLLIIY